MTFIFKKPVNTKRDTIDQNSNHRIAIGYIHNQIGIMETNINPLNSMVVTIDIFGVYFCSIDGADTVSRALILSRSLDARS